MSWGLEKVKEKRRKVGFHSEIGAKLLCANVVQRRKIQLRSERKGDAVFTGDFWRVEKKQFMHDACGKCGTVYRRACLHEDAENFAAAEFRQYRRQIDPAIFSFRADNFNARVLQLAHFC